MADMKLEVYCSFLQQARYLWFRDGGTSIPLGPVGALGSLHVALYNWAFPHHGTTLIFLFMPSKKEGKRKSECRASCSPSLTQSLASGHTLPG